MKIPLRSQHADIKEIKPGLVPNLPENSILAPRLLYKD
jgi:hypothetical protein